LLPDFFYFINKEEIRKQIKICFVISFFV